MLIISALSLLLCSNSSGKTLEDGVVRLRLFLLPKMIDGSSGGYSFGKYYYYDTDYEKEDRSYRV